MCLQFVTMFNFIVFIILDVDLVFAVNFIELSTLTLMPSGSSRGKDTIIDADGFQYHLKAKQPNVTYWRCSMRNKAVNCHAALIQRGCTFARGIREHHHTAPPFKQKQPVFAAPINLALDPAVCEKYLFRPMDGDGTI